MVILPQGGHSLGGLVGTECIERIAADFLESADPDGLDTACVGEMHRKPFILDKADDS